MTTQTMDLINQAIDIICAAVTKHIEENPDSIVENKALAAATELLTLHCNISLKQPGQRLKLQMSVPAGWGDVKASEDDGATYATEYYDTFEAAAEELCSFPGHEEGNSEYRIVHEGVPQDWDCYS